MKIGLGLYRQMLNEDHYRFAQQLGVSHVVAHLEDYFSADPQLANDQDDTWGNRHGPHDRCAERQWLQGRPDPGSYPGTALQGSMACGQGFCDRLHEGAARGLTEGGIL